MELVVANSYTTCTNSVYKSTTDSMHLFTYFHQLGSLPLLYFSLFPRQTLSMGSHGCAALLLPHSFGEYVPYKVLEGPQTS